MQQKRLLTGRKTYQSAPGGNRMQRRAKTPRAKNELLNNDPGTKCPDGCHKPDCTARGGLTLNNLVATGVKGVPLRLHRCVVDLSLRRPPCHKLAGEQNPLTM